MDWDWPSFVVFIDSTDSGKPKSLVYNYQSLIAGILALFAAILTTFILIWHQDSARRRRHAATRAQLPMALSKLHRYADKCLSELASLMRGRSEEDDIRQDFSVPDLPEDSILIISKLIEAGPKADAKYLQALLRQIQIQHSRLDSTARDTSTMRNQGNITSLHNIRHDVLDAYIIKTMADHIFDFARWETKRIRNYDASTAELKGKFYLERDFSTETSKFITDKLIRYVARSFKRGDD
ncbi:MAG: hypothetical protein ABNH53_09100 [Henriciella sp.]